MDLVSLTFVATAGTLTSTVSGSVKYSNLENLGYATSWIPTNGAIATRAAELCVDATPTINSEEGVLYLEARGLVDGVANRYVTISDGSGNNRLQILYQGATNRLSISGKKGNAALSSLNYFSFTQTDNHKIAVVYSALGAKLFVDGVERDSNTNDVSFPIGTFTDLEFALWNSSSGPFYGRTKDLRIYTKALTDERLEDLTTLPPPPPPDNLPDNTVNLALIAEATLSGSVSSGRGTPETVMYDPAADDYYIRTGYNEYGVTYGVNLGTPDADNGFFWRVDWPDHKYVNYITFGGTYDNQPQPNSLWRVSYFYNGNWTTLEEGVGGWIDSGIYEWGGVSQTPIAASALRVQVYSDGVNDLLNIHLRARGGRSSSVDDRSTTPKATLIQYIT